MGCHVLRISYAEGLFEAVFFALGIHRNMSVRDWEDFKGEVNARLGAAGFYGEVQKLN